MNIDCSIKKKKQTKIKSKVNSFSPWISEFSTDLAYLIFFDKSVKELLQECSQELHHILSSGKPWVFIIFAEIMTMFFLNPNDSCTLFFAACIPTFKDKLLDSKNYNFILRWDSLTSRLPKAVATFTWRNNVDSENCNVYQSVLYYDTVCPWCS